MNFLSFDNEGLIFNFLIKYPHNVVSVYRGSSFLSKRLSHQIIYLVTRFLKVGVQVYVLHEANRTHIAVPCLLEVA